MNQRRRHVNRPIYYHQCAPWLSESQLIRLTLLSLLLFFLLTILEYLAIGVEILKLFVNVYGDIFADLRVPLVLNVRFLANCAAQRVQLLGKIFYGPHFWLPDELRYLIYICSDLEYVVLPDLKVEVEFE
jgi:hypothetical protein